MYPQVCERVAYLSTKLCLEKSGRQKIKASTIFGGFWGQN